MTDTQKAIEAAENLRTCQRQLDMDGIIVGVSREALDIVLAALTAPAEPVAYTSEAMIKLLKSDNAEYGAAYLMSKRPHLSMSVPLYTSPPDQSARIAELEAEIAAIKAGLNTEKNPELGEYFKLPSDSPIAVALHSKVKEK